MVYHVGIVPVIGLMSAIKQFNSIDYGSLSVIVDDSGKEWFRAIDACVALSHGNATQAIKRHVDPEYVKPFDDGTNRAGDTNYISEPGFYQLIFGSKTAKAKGFQKWVFEEVLPKLRAEGGYVMPSATLEQALALAAHHEQRLNHFISGVKRYEDMWMLYNRPGLMLIAQKELVEPKYSTEEKESVRLLFERLKTQTFATDRWTQTKHLVGFIDDRIGLHIDKPILNIWMAEWGYHIRGRKDNCYDLMVHLPRAITIKANKVLRELYGHEPLLTSSPNYA